VGSQTQYFPDFNTASFFSRSSTWSSPYYRLQPNGIVIFIFEKVISLTHCSLLPLKAIKHLDRILSGLPFEVCPAQHTVHQPQAAAKKEPVVAAEQAVQLTAILTEDHAPKDKREHLDLVGCG
jgi:hypothetical protein